MLERLEQLAGADARVAEALAAKDTSQLIGAVERALVAQPAIFAEAVDQLTCGDVQGCAPDQQRADTARSRGNAHFHGGEYGRAVESYTEALQDQQALTPSGRASASRLLSNRAAALLRLQPATPEAAKAALMDAHCAVRADPTFTKAHYRAACARKLMGDLQGAIEDCMRAVGGCGGQAGGQPAEGGCAAGAAAQVDEAGALLAELRLQLEQGREGATAPGGQRGALDSSWAADVVDERVGGAGGGTMKVEPVCAADPRVAEATSPELGRHLVVLEEEPPLPPATDVLYDRPLALVLSKRWRRRGGGGRGGNPGTTLRCWRCTAPLDGRGGTVPYPCLYCPMAQYCSPYCRDSDSFHAPGGCECGLPWTHLLPEEALLACRLARRAAVEIQEAGPAARGEAAAPAGAAAAIKSDGGGPAGLPAAARAPRGGDLPQHASGPPPSLPTRELLERLLTHCRSMAPPDLLNAAVLAATTAAAYSSACREALRRWQQQRLQPLEDELLPTQAQEQAGAEAGQSTGGGAHQRLRWLSGGVPVRGLRPPEVTAEQIFQMMCRVRVNGIAVRPDAMTGSYDRLALALYPRAALLNHSCVPNLGMRFLGLQLVARTCRSVPPGEQLTISYGPQRGKAPRRERLAGLQAQYAFTCGCESCTDPGDGPPVEPQLEAALWGLQCPSCRTASEDGASRGDLVADSGEQRLPAAVVPADPRVAAMCGAGLNKESPRGDPVCRLGSRPEVSVEGGRGGPCASCGGRLTGAEEAAAAAVLAEAARMTERAAAAHDAGNPAAGPSGRGSSAPGDGARQDGAEVQSVVALMRSWGLLRQAAELRSQVLPATSRLLGGTLHQLGEAAARVLHAAAAPTRARGARGGGGGGGSPAASELAAMAADAARCVSRSLAALQLVYGSCSTEVLYELEVLIQVLDAAAAAGVAADLGLADGEGGGAVAQVAGSAHAGSCGGGGGGAGAAVGPRSAQSPPAEAEAEAPGAAGAALKCCSSCGAAGGAHEAAVQVHMARLLARLGGLVSSSARAAAARPTSGAGTGPFTFGGEGVGSEGLPAGARALHRCLAWHLLGQGAA